MTDELQYYSKTDLSKYAGEWIAILDHEVIAHGKDLKKVYSEANEKAKGKEPFFMKVPKSEQTLIL